MSTKRKAVLAVILGALVAGLLGLTMVFPSFQKILVLARTPTPSLPFTYTVVAGDTLSGIAHKFNLGKDGVKFLMILNPPFTDPDTNITADPTMIYPGQMLLIPGAGMQLPVTTNQ